MFNAIFRSFLIAVVVSLLAVAIIVVLGTKHYPLESSKIATSTHSGYLNAGPTDKSVDVREGLKLLIFFIKYPRVGIDVMLPQFLIAFACCWVASLLSSIWITFPSRSRSGR